MGEEKAISSDQRLEKAIAWSIRCTKKQESVLKSFPMTMEAKKPYSSPYFGAKTSKILPDPKTFIYLLIYLSVREDFKVQCHLRAKTFERVASGCSSFFFAKGNVATGSSGHQAKPSWKTATA